MEKASVIFLLIFCCGCAAMKVDRKLRRAKRLIGEAVQAGAVVRADTTFAKLNFRLPADSVRGRLFDLTQPFAISSLSGLRVRVTPYDTAGRRAYLVQGDVPERTVQEDCPVVVSQVVECPPCATKSRTGSFMDRVRFLGDFALGIILGYLLGRIFK